MIIPINYQSLMVMVVMVLSHLYYQLFSPIFYLYLNYYNYKLLSYLDQFFLHKLIIIEMFLQMILWEVIFH